MCYRLAVGVFVLLHLASCGTTATEIGERTNSMINRQEQAIDTERGKIVYTSEACEGNTEGVDSSRCARVLKDKDAKDSEKPPKKK